MLTDRSQGWLRPLGASACRDVNLDTLSGFAGFQLRRLFSLGASSRSLQHRAISTAVAHFLHTEGVTGSNPVSPMFSVSFPGTPQPPLRLA